MNNHKTQAQASRYRKTMPHKQTMISPFQNFTHAPKQQEAIVALARGRRCTACPGATHINTGNIIYQQNTKPKGSRVKWPQWTTQLVHVVIKQQQNVGVKDIVLIQQYDKAEVYKPDVLQAYNHVGVHTQRPTRASHKDTAKAFLHMYINDSISKQRSAFWCIKNVQDKIMIIFLVDIVPQHPIWYQDVNLLSRRDSHLFCISRSSLPVSPFPDVNTPTGIIRVLDSDNRDHTEVAMELSQQLQRNCGIPM